MMRFDRLVKQLLVLGSLVLLVASCATAVPVAPTDTPAVQVAPSSTTAPTSAPTAPPQATPTSAPEPTATAEPVSSGPPLPTPTLASSGMPSSYEEMQRISPEELLVLIDSAADIVVVDVQPQGAYDLGHVPGAVNLPWEMELSSSGDLPGDKLLVFYCPCPNEEDAGDTAMQLVSRWSYKNVMLLDGGWMRWLELEYPTEGGE